MNEFKNANVGTPIEVDDRCNLIVPDDPIIPFIEGDGIGPDIWKAAVLVFDKAVQKAYGNKRKVQWLEVLAGQKAYDFVKQWLPQVTLDAFEKYRVGIKGPLTTPIGEGIRSLNVALRQKLDLYVCLRPVRWFRGVPSPVKEPERVNMVVFRENTEDIYAGVEWQADSFDGQAFISLLKNHFPEQYKKIRFPESSGIGIKPISQEGSERLVRAAIRYALANKRRFLTFVHKGNIMKFTEGAFREWGYALAQKEFADCTYTVNQWQDTAKTKGQERANLEKERALVDGKIFINDVIADIALQQVLTRPDDFDVIATLNLNGDYLSDALAAQVGGIGIAPGGNFNEVTRHAIFEATHGTAPRYANLDKVNPSSLILSGVMMFNYLGWTKAADYIEKAIEKAIEGKYVTYDFARLMDQAKEVRCSEFAQKVIECM